MYTEIYKTLYKNAEIMTAVTSVDGLNFEQVNLLSSLGTAVRTKGEVSMAKNLLEKEKNNPNVFQQIYQQRMAFAEPQRCGCSEDFCPHQNGV